MKRYRNVNNRGSVVKCRRPLLPRVEPVSVDAGNGFYTRELVITVWRRVWRWGWYSAIVKTGELVPASRNSNNPSRRRTLNYKRMMKRHISDTATSKLTRKFHL